MAGVLDLNTSSNSDVGLSGSFTPFVKLYDKFYFTPDQEPCQARYEFEKALEAEGYRKLGVSDFAAYVKKITRNDKFRDLLEYAPITIVEKEAPQRTYEVPDYSYNEAFVQTEEPDGESEGAEESKE